MEIKERLEHIKSQCDKGKRAVEAKICTIDGDTTFGEITHIGDDFVEICDGPRLEIINLKNIARLEIDVYGDLTINKEYYSDDEKTDASRLVK